MAGCKLRRNPLSIQVCFNPLPRNRHRCLPRKSRNPLSIQVCFNQIEFASIRDYEACRNPLSIQVCFNGGLPIRQCTWLEISRNPLSIQVCFNFEDGAIYWVAKDVS